MPEPTTLVLFAVSSLALAAVPGPAVLYIVARSLEQGRAAGLLSALGILVGGLVHFIAAALGLSALLASSAVAFSTVKFLGAAYLIYVGLQTLFSRPASHEAQVLTRQPLRRVFLQGIVVEVLNPKVALFVLAFLPHFLDPARGSLVVQALILGTVFVTVAFMSDSIYALLAGSFGMWLRRRPGFVNAQRYVSGTVYVGLGLATAITGTGKD